MRVANMCLGFIFLLFAGALYLAAVELPVSPSFGDTGPAEFPLIIAGVAAVMAVSLIGQGAFAPRGTDTAKKVIPPRAWAFLIWSVLAAMALPVLHTLATLLIYVFGSILIQGGKKKSGLAALSAVLITVMVYGLFGMLLSVPLP